MTIGLKRKGCCVRRVTYVLVLATLLLSSCANGKESWREYYQLDRGKSEVVLIETNYSVPLDSPVG